MSKQRVFHQDRLKPVAGASQRSVAQVNRTPDAQSFPMARLDHQSISNWSPPGWTCVIATMPFLESLRNAQTVSLSSLDPRKTRPSFETER